MTGGGRNPLFRGPVLFQPEGPAIRAGLFMVKGLGTRGAAAILRERERGAFRSRDDFRLRLQDKVTARAIANLIRAGAFDAFGPRNAQLLALHTGWTKGGPERGTDAPDNCCFSPRPPWGRVVRGGDRGSVKVG